ncbi:hypothetical protein [Chachezhania antarctica]|uniref:hypothetical protein n=1 Tax=Chachezhania antarctica TaxID=2340860 RepID=UPI0013CE4A57|nr:hypothetical protein [Chachezhania antarctica]|tara:strand:+ start:3133 stop:3528 length:396 start_codon:yes stop_codon:yes gene_type:complete
MLIDRAMAEGEIRPVNARVTSYLVLGAMNWILRWHTEDEGMSPEDIADHFLDLFLNGMVETQTACPTSDNQESPKLGPPCSLADEIPARASGDTLFVSTQKGAGSGVGSPGRIPPTFPPPHRERSAPPRSG